MLFHDTPYAAEVQVSTIAFQNAVKTIGSKQDLLTRPASCAIGTIPCPGRRSPEKHDTRTRERVAAAVGRRVARCTTSPLESCAATLTMAALSTPRRGRESRSAPVASQCLVQSGRLPTQHALRRVMLLEGSLDDQSAQPHRLYSSRLDRHALCPATSSAGGH